MTSASSSPPPEPLPVVERTSVGVAPHVPARLAAALDDLRLLPSPPSLAPLMRWACQGSLALVHQVPADAVTLASLRDAGPLRAGHVLAAALAAATALAALHAHGLAHGAVDVDHLLVAPDGSVVLAGTGAAWLDAPRCMDGPHPSDDIAAVGDLVRLLLGRGAAPGALVLAALRAGDADPALRPTAQELVAALGRCGRPEPLLGPLWGAPSRAGDPEGAAGAEQAKLVDVADHADHADVVDVADHADLVAVADRAGPRSLGSPGSPGSPAGRGEDRTPAGSAPARRPDRLPVRRGPGDVPARPGARSSSSAHRPDVPRARHARSGRPSRSAGRRAGRGRTWMLALLALAVGALVMRAVPVVVAAAQPASVPATPPPAAGPTAAAPSATAQRAAPSTDWAAVLAALDSGRRRALGSGSVDELARYVDPDGAAWPDDRALLDRLAASGARLEGGGIELADVRVEEVGQDRVRLVVRDRRLGYDVVDGSGRVRVEASGWRWWTVVLSALPSLDGPAWRVADVRGSDDRAAP